MLAYNHEDFIGKAIESVLSQESTYDIELVIGNDCSTDKTVEIITNFRDTHEKGAWIKLFDHKENLGIIPNFVFTLGQCKGKYIAILEGDDYWTDVHKIQKQVDFLEEHTDFIAHSHNTNFIGLQTGSFSKQPSRAVAFSELLGHRPFHTASLVFRADNMQRPLVPSTILSGDRALFLHVASYGKIWYDSEVMAVYRKNDGGISRRVTVSQMKKDLAMIPFFKKRRLKIPYRKLKRFIYETMIIYPVRPKRKELVIPFLKHTYYSMVTFYFSKKTHVSILKRLLKKP